MQSASARGERSSSKLESGAAVRFSTSKITVSFMVRLMPCCETKMEPGGTRSKPETPLPTAAGALPSSSSPACVPGQQARSLLSYLCWVLYPGNIAHVKVQKTPCGPLSCCEGCLESMNKTHPQRNGDVAILDSTKSFSGERDRCRPRSARAGCTRGHGCVSAAALLVLAAAVGSAVALALLLRPPVNRFCAASNNRTGFLCDDRATCIPASQVCDRVSHCRSGEDEQEKLCGDLPRSLPGYLVFRCSNPAYWVYADQRCNGMNDCGDCSDEMGSLAACPPCGSEWWSCSPVLYEYCSCVPRRLCRDGVQHCLGWSDEYICRP